MNELNYLNHSLYKPDTYFRRFDFDANWWGDKVKRAATAMLPFIALYAPAGMALSVLGNGSRMISHIGAAIEKKEENNWKQVAVETGKMALAILALSATLFHFTTGLFITTGSDVVHGIYNTGSALWQGEYGKSCGEALQTLSSSVYLGFMVSGALEAMLLFALFQVMSSLYQSRGDFKEGNYIEAAAKMAMGCVRLHSAHHYFGAIQKRDDFLKLGSAASVFAKIAKGREASHLVRHPLSSLKERIDSNDLVFTDDKGKEIHLGAHFHGNGKALVKGENIAFRRRIVNGKEVIELEFKINHAFREGLAKTIAELRNIHPQHMEEILALAGSHANSICIQSGNFFKDRDLYFGSVGNAHKINIEGLGTILVGAEKSQPNLYDKVVVQMDSNQNLYSLHEMLCLLDLETALCLSTKEDIERLKMGHLFRTFFPKEALSFERSAEYFSLSLDQLKAKMIEKAPEMEKIFATYYHRMKPESIIGGRVRYRIEGLAEAAYKEGARALTAAVTGGYSDEALFERVASIIQSGMLSTEVRHTSDVTTGGLSPTYDYLTGGADSVYTQMLTENACKNHVPLDQLYHSPVRLLISLDALELGTYQYNFDFFGTRRVSETLSGTFYANRENILEFVRKEQLSFHRRNEVMLKERLSASFLKGLIVSNEATKLKLIDYLQRRNLIQDNSILNISVDRFIRVGTHLSEELIA